MTLRVSGQNLDIGDALRTHVQARVADSLSKYFDQAYTGQVTVKKEGTGFRTDCRIHLPTGLTLQTESMAHDPHASVDLATERLTKRLKRYKHRIKDYHAGPDTGTTAESTDYIITALSEEEAVPDEFTPVIVAGLGPVSRKPSPLNAALLKNPGVSLVILIWVGVTSAEIPSPAEVNVTPPGVTTWVPSSSATVDWSG